MELLESHCKKSTLEHAQAFMMALCDEETVIIGHAVHNDLIALKMEHISNFDTSYLYYKRLNLFVSQ